MEKKWNFSIPKIFVTANNKELANRFHSFTAATHIDTRSFFPTLFVLLVLSSSEN